METENQQFADASSAESQEIGNQDSQQPQDASATENVAEAIAEIEKLAKFKFQGQEWTPKELERAILRQKDYTQKTQQIAQVKKEFESQQKFYLNYAADLRTIEKSSPEQRQALISEFIKIYPQQFHSELDKALRNLSGQDQSSATRTQQSHTPDVALLSRLQSLEKIHHEQAVERSRASIESNIQKLSSKYKDAIPELVIGRVFEAYNQLAEQDPQAKLTDKMWEDTFKTVDEEMKSRMKNNYGDLVKKQTEANAKGKAPDASGGTVGRAPHKFKSLKEATQHAIRDLSGRGQN